MTVSAAHRRIRRPTPAEVRAVAYTRRSVEKVVEEFGSIEAQLAAIESYVASQRERGWVLLPDRYEDRNLSGATTDRPALQRLLTDAEAGRFDVLLVYKLDRISRRLIDFLDLLARLERCGVSVVSITQSIDTGNPTGRLMVNLLGSFAEYEREQIAQRVADKMLAARRLGKWQGGRPSLGYDVVNKELVVNPAEAADVVAIFETFLRTRSLVGTLRELERRGIVNKSWVGKRGQYVQGTAFTKNSLAHLLQNELYIARIRAGDEVVPAEHTAIVPQELFDTVQAIFTDRQLDRRPERQDWSAFLAGLLFCGRCGAAMTPSYTVKRAKRYGAYQCRRQKSHGAAACPGSRVAQGPIEVAVVEQIMAVGRDPALLAEAVQSAREEIDRKAGELAQDAQRAGTQAHRLAAERADLVARGADVPELRRRLDELAEAHETATGRAEAAKAELKALKANAVDEDALRRAIESFAPVWAELFPDERARLVHLLVERVSINAATGDVEVTLRDDGIAQLAREVEP
jgi:site-specific DNA recombinase